MEGRSVSNVYATRVAVCCYIRNEREVDILTERMEDFFLKPRRRRPDAAQP